MCVRVNLCTKEAPCDTESDQLGVPGGFQKNRLLRHQRVFQAVAGRSEVPYLLLTQHSFLSSCMTGSALHLTIDTCIHLSSVCLPVDFRKPLDGTAPGVILARRSIDVNPLDSVTADAHFFPSFSSLILGLVFLSCFPIMLVMDMSACALDLRLFTTLTISQDYSLSFLYTGNSSA